MKCSRNKLGHQVAGIGFVIKAKICFYYDIQTRFKVLESIMISIRYRRDIIGWE